MEIKIVLGYLFGDEGKGVTVQWLCQKAIDEGKKPLVIRFSGGPQAAHTINLGDKEHICSSFGSGVLLGVPTLYTPNVYVDPICLMNEYKILKEKGIEPLIDIDSKCRTITPYDVLNGRSNSNVLAHGTCGKGIYQCFKRQLNQFGYVKPEKMLLDSRLEQEFDFELEEMFIENYKKLYEFDNFVLLQDYDVLIFEGTQGLLLDMDNGFYPNVTPSRVGLNGIDKTKYLYNAEVYLVTRSYLTRHGNGYEPKYQIIVNDHETNINNEYQGNFKTGLHEYELFTKAGQRHCLDNYQKMYNCKFNLVMTHYDSQLNCEFTNDIILQNIINHSIINFNNVYINDSIYSNIKEYK